MHKWYKIDAEHEHPRGGGGRHDDSYLPPTGQTGEIYIPSKKHITRLIYSKLSPIGCLRRPIHDKYI